MASNGSSNEIIRQKRNKAIAHALCKRLSLDPKSFLSDTTENDIKSLLSNFQKLTGKQVPIGKIDEVMSWVAFADSFPVDSEACHGVVRGLNEDLTLRSVLLGDGLTSSEADIIVFSALHSFITGLSNSDRIKYPHVLRWMDYIQSSEDFGAIFEMILLERAKFEPPLSKLQGSKNVAKVEVVQVDSKIQKKMDNVEAEFNSKKSVTEKIKEKVVGDNKVTEEKKKLPEKEAVEKDKEVSVSLLNIQVGIIRKAWKHPSADSLLVEEIDLGEAKLRQVVSGLAKYCSPDDLMNRRVALITNVKPGKLRDHMSEGLVLCASSQDHTVVEPLLPPEGAKLGERVSFSGHDGKPEDVLNPKKKQLEKITPHLYTDDKGVATYKGIPFTTSSGPCMSSIPNASIR